MNAAREMKGELSWANSQLGRADVFLASPVCWKCSLEPCVEKGDGACPVGRVVEGGREEMERHGVEGLAGLCVHCAHTGQRRGSGSLNAMYMLFLVGD